MEKIKNIIDFIIKITSVLAGILFMIAITGLDSETPIPFIVCIFCIAWFVLMYFIYGRYTEEE